MPDTTTVPDVSPARWVSNRASIRSACSTSLSASKAGTIRWSPSGRYTGGATEASRTEGKERRSRPFLAMPISSCQVSCLGVPSAAMRSFAGSMTASKPARS